MDTTTLPAEAHTPSYTKADGESIKYSLRTIDRGDCCGAQAYFKVWLNSSKDLPPLLFCRHHFYEHKAVIIPQARKVHDESFRLEDNRLIGSEN